MFLNQIRLQDIRKSFEDVHLDVKICILPHHDFVTVITLMYIEPIWFCDVFFQEFVAPTLTDGFDS